MDPMCINGPAALDAGRPPVRGAELRCHGQPPITSRCWWEFVPTSLRVPPPGAASRPVALHVDLHGATSCAYQRAAKSGYASAAEAAPDAIVVWPNAKTSELWNAGSCCAGNPPATDDLGFLRQMVADVVAQRRASPHPINLRRIFVTGHAEGCMLAQSLLIWLPGLFAAAACTSGYLQVEPPADAPSAGSPADALRAGAPAAFVPTPLLLVHGMRDQWSAYSGRGAHHHQHYADYAELLD